MCGMKAAALMKTGKMEETVATASKDIKQVHNPIPSELSRNTKTDTVVIPADIFLNLVTCFCFVSDYQDTEERAMA